jgi:hypothetical protein
MLLYSSNVLENKALVKPFEKLPEEPEASCPQAQAGLYYDPWIVPIIQSGRSACSPSHKWTCSSKTFPLFPSRRLLSTAHKHDGADQTEQADPIMGFTTIVGSGIPRVAVHPILQSGHNVVGGYLQPATTSNHFTRPASPWSEPRRF